MCIHQASVRRMTSKLLCTDYALSVAAPVTATFFVTTWVSCRYTGSGLFDRLSLSFGYLNKQGYCSRSNPNNCHQFPVVIGETGTTFALQADQQQMADFALYLNNQGAGNDGQHNPISSWFWWAWNANSGQLLPFNYIM